MIQTFSKSRGAKARGTKIRGAKGWGTRVQGATDWEAKDLGRQKTWGQKVRRQNGRRQKTGGQMTGGQMYHHQNIIACEPLNILHEYGYVKIDYGPIRMHDCLLINIQLFH